MNIKDQLRNKRNESNMNRNKLQKRSMFQGGQFQIGKMVKVILI